MEKAFRELFKWMNEKEITWALGASSVLYYNGDDRLPNDYDVFVTVEDFDQVEERLKQSGEERFKENALGIYATERFATYMLGNREIDLIAGFNILHDQGEYRLTFDEDSIDKTIAVEDVPIHIMALEDWFVMYQLIPGRSAKAERALELMRSKNQMRWDLFDRALESGLPKKVRESIQELTR
jgi:deoxyhypusine synthase